MSCENQGHVGAADSGHPPEYRCLYCGEWGYAPSWFTEDTEAYEECDCTLTYEGHKLTCE